jgi:hypothetical protein
MESMEGPREQSLCLRVLQGGRLGITLLGAWKLPKSARGLDAGIVLALALGGALLGRRSVGRIIDLAIDTENSRFHN